MELLGINIRRIKAIITSSVPFEAGPPTQNLDEGNQWSDILEYCETDPDKIQWELSTRSAEPNEMLYEQKRKWNRWLSKGLSCGTGAPSHLQTLTNVLIEHGEHRFSFNGLWTR